MITIETGDSGFKIICADKVHYVGTFEELQKTLDSLIVSKGRGKSTRYQIRGAEEIADAMIEGNTNQAPAFPEGCGA